MKIGLIREGKIPFDRRVALPPQLCKSLLEKYPHLSIFCQPSSFRSFSDSEYQQCNVPLNEDMTYCDVLFGIKEIPVDQLIHDKTYFFFSHTLKKQPYNRRLLQEVLKRNITLIDYEAIVDEKGERLVAFGKYAGIVGAYNAFRTLGLKYKTFTLPPAYTLFDKAEMLTLLKQAPLPAIKIVVTGGGRVASGVREVLDAISMEQVSSEAFFYREFSEPVYVMPSSSDYHIAQDGAFDRGRFYADPSTFKSTFINYACAADMLIAAAYWNPAAPKLFSSKDMRHPSFRLKIIADITCDINGSIPSTLRPSTIYDPFYDYNPVSEGLEPAFSKESNVTVMAIDNLPTELPRDASLFFGQQLIAHVFPALMDHQSKENLDNSIIAKGGRLTPRFSFLQDYVDSK